MEEKDNKGGMGEKNLRGQTAYTLISPTVAVSVVHWFCL